MAKKRNKRTRRTSSGKGQRRKEHLKNLVRHPLIQGLVKARNGKERQDLLGQFAASLQQGLPTESPLLAIPPPATPMEYLLEVTQKRSSIPIALPFWTAMTLTAHHLTSQSAIIDVDGVMVRPILYTLICADSGEAKTVTFKLISDCMNVDCGDPSVPKSAEGLLTDAMNHDGKARILCIDEFGRQWSRWLRDDSASMIMEFLLMAYTQESFKRGLKNKSDAYLIENPIISLLTYTQIANFADHFTAESFQSGFMQRLTIAVGQLREGWQKKLSLGPWKRAIEEEIKPRFREVFENCPIHPRYTLSHSAHCTMQYHIENLVERFDMTKGFALRGYYTLPRFALIWHYLCGKVSSELDKQDMELAVKTLESSWIDLRFLMDESERGALSEVIEKSVSTLRRLYRGELKSSPEDYERNPGRWLTNNVRAVKNGDLDATTLKLLVEIVNLELPGIMRETWANTHLNEVEIARAKLNEELLEQAEIFISSREEFCSSAI